MLPLIYHSPELYHLHASFGCAHASDAQGLSVVIYEAFVKYYGVYVLLSPSFLPEAPGIGNKSCPRKS